MIKTFMIIGKNDEKYNDNLWGNGSKWFSKRVNQWRPTLKKNPTFFMEKQQDLSPPVAASVLRILPNFLQFLLGLYHNRDCDYTDNLLYFF